MNALEHYIFLIEFLIYKLRIITYLVILLIGLYQDVGLWPMVLTQDIAVMQLSLPLKA